MTGGSLILTSVEEPTDDQIEWEKSSTCPLSLLALKNGGGDKLN